MSAPPPKASKPSKSSRSGSGASGSSSSRTDIWGVVLEHNKAERKKVGDVRTDTNVLVVGAKGCGKTTLIMRFLNPERSDSHRETMGLDYVFARRSKGTDMEKQVAHIWELGGGEDQANLMDAVVTPENLRNFVCVIAVDLDDPGKAVESLLFWLNRVKGRVESCLKVMASKRSSLPDRLRAKAKQDFDGAFATPITKRAHSPADTAAPPEPSAPEAHPDTALVQLSAVPIIISCTKFDRFAEQDSKYRKVMARTLRYVAHTHGAALHYCSVNSKPLLNQYRAVLNKTFFGASTAASRVCVDPGKALAIPAGADHIASIGAPSGAAAGMPPLEQHKAAYGQFFSATKGEAEDAEGDTTEAAQAMDEELAQFTERTIDLMAQEKAQLLERYRSESAGEKKSKR